MPSEGCFQWTAGGWFGSQTGSTLWMLVAAVVCLTEAPWASTACVLCFIAANAAGTWLWSRRDRLRPYPAMQWLVGIVATTGLLAMVSIRALGPSGFEPNARWNREINRGILIMLVGAPAFLFYMALLERSAKKARTRR
jgi:hypothetical protein